MDAPVSIYRDTDDPSVLWRFREGTEDSSPVSELPEYFELEVYWRGQSAPMLYSSAGDAPALSLDRTKGELTWDYALSDSHRVPLGSRARYGLYGYSSGKRRFWVGGPVNVGTYRQ